MVDAVPETVALIILEDDNYSVQLPDRDDILRPVSRERIDVDVDDPLTIVPGVFLGEYEDLKEAFFPEERFAYHLELDWLRPEEYVEVFDFSWTASRLKDGRSPTLARRASGRSTPLLTPSEMTLRRT